MLLRQALQDSASRDMQFSSDGRQSAETLSIEAELSQVINYWKNIDRQTRCVEILKLNKNTTLSFICW